MIIPPYPRCHHHHRTPPIRTRTCSTLVIPSIRTRPARHRTMPPRWTTSHRPTPTSTFIRCILPAICLCQPPGRRRRPIFLQRRSILTPTIPLPCRTVTTVRRRKGRCSPSSSRNEWQPVFSLVRVLVTSASNSSTGTSASKQPCLVCHEKSSGYHFGAYTCESCKAFYRRVTKDSHIQIKHSCEVPLPNITKSNRKDCRACRKAKCERVGMTVMPKDRPLRTTKSKSTTKFPSIPVTDLLEQLGRDLIYDQLSSSSAFETLLHLIDIPSFHPMALDYHSLYMDASRLWRNQQQCHPAELTDNGTFIDTFAVLLVLFRTFMTLTENDDDKSNDNSKFGKLVSILQQEIHRLTGTDHRSARRIKALFMKCYVTLAQYSNSTSYLDQNPMSQGPFLAYQPYAGAYSQ